MDIVTTISTDQVLENCILTIMKSGNNVEKLSYEHITNKITYDARADINISLQEFFDYVAQVNIFQQAILNKYNPNVFATVPFGSCNTVEHHDIAMQKWSLVCIYGSVPRLCNYSCDIASFTIDLIARAAPKTIELPEWSYFLMQLNHYLKSLKAL